MKHLLQYIGILLGAMYGYCYRLLCGTEKADAIYDYSIYSISFIWILPIAISIIPILFAKKEILASKWKQFLFPFCSVLLFFLLALSRGLEDWLCILIIAFPFLLTAGITGLLVTSLIKDRNSKKLYTIILLPLLLNPLESYLPNQKESFLVEKSITIDAKKETVWGNLIEVPEIKNEEFNPGFYNFIGVPRPVKSELKTIDDQEYRIGHFTDGLKLYETISQIDTNHFVAFNIHLNKSKLRDLPTDQHLLNSNYFNFETISYQVVELESNRIKLILRCKYNLNSKMNTYANFWAKEIITDFEERLLEALKLKIERENQS